MSSAKWRPFCLGLNVLKGMNECILLNNVADEVWKIITARD